MNTAANVVAEGLATSPIPFVFFFNDTAPTEIYTLSLHDALPIFRPLRQGGQPRVAERRPQPPHLLRAAPGEQAQRSEEHTSELQSRLHLVCRLLLEKKKSRSRSALRQTAAEPTTATRLSRRLPRG